MFLEVFFDAPEQGGKKAAIPAFPPCFHANWDPLVPACVLQSCSCLGQQEKLRAQLAAGPKPTWWR